MGDTYKKFRLTFFLFVFYRLLSVFFITTSYVPDEYWQSLEVAHNLAFGYGYLTWEWKQGIRSYLYPIIFYVFYKALEYLHLDYAIILITLPKLLQAIFTAISDLYFYLLCKNFGFDDYWIKIAIFTNWFWFYCGMRTIINTFETCMTVIALYYYPWPTFINRAKNNIKTQDAVWSDIQQRSRKYLTLAAINCLVRPTAFTVWIPLIFFQWFFLKPNNSKKFFFNCLVPACIITVPISLIIDYICYGKLVIPILNFLFFNIFKNVSSHYGTHSFHWYFSQGLPVVLGLQYIPFLMGLIFFILLDLSNHKNKHKSAFLLLLITAFLNIMILSLVFHKEFRFILPIMPLMMIIAIKFETEFFVGRKILKLIWTLILCGSFIISTTVFGIHHQKGPHQLMSYLRSEMLSKDHHSLLFLMPCHSTPLYSHLHVNVSIRFLECEPPLTQSHYDESEVFFSDPNKWLNMYWKEQKVGSPSHIIFFDDLENEIESFLNKERYEKDKEILHTILARRNYRRFIYVYKRRKA